VFESGKVYIKRKIGEFVEEKRIEAIYSGYDFAKIKGDLLALLSKLGLNETKWREGKGFLEYTIGGDPIAILNSNGYEILLDNLVDKVNVRKVPYSELSTTFLQTIVEEVSLILNKNEKLGAVANALSEASDYISSVDLADIYEDVKLGGQKISATFRMVIEDAEKTLTREKVEELKNKALKSVKSSFGAEIRK
jgi:phenylalanyl-tRNA synthetase beta subunit